MEGENSTEHSLLSLSLALGGNANDVSSLPSNDPIEHFHMEGGMKQDNPSVLPSPQWIYCQQEDYDYNYFGAENSAFVQKAYTADVLQGIPSVVGSIPTVNGASEIHTEILFHNSLKACCSIPVDSSCVMDTQKVGYLRQRGEREPANQLTRTHSQDIAQNLTNWGENLNEDRCNLLRDRVSRRRQRNSEANEKSYATDRHRRVRIAERIDALQELLPHPQEGNQACKLDDIIDHIKNLQLQVKDLSMRRLGGESTSNPLIFFEGHGNYLPDDQTLKAPLEEVMGKLLEEDPSAAALLLEQRGLFVMPIDLAERLKNQAK